eukprot:scaffold2438_cov257-Pinguiococcus_pyrenoidosus.AAC.6
MSQHAQSISQRHCASTYHHPCDRRHRGDSPPPTPPAPLPVDRETLGACAPRSAAAAPAQHPPQLGSCPHDRSARPRSPTTDAAGSLPGAEGTTERAVAGFASSGSSPRQVQRPCYPCYPRSPRYPWYPRSYGDLGPSF